MSYIVEIFAILVLISLTTALIGNFLVLRGTSLISFALSHSVLFGIIVVFLSTNDLNSPFLIAGAALTGVIIVSLVEVLTKSKYIKYDAALGLVYLSIFSLGIILVSKYAEDTNLSVKSVLSGQVLFTPFTRFYVFGIDLGPKVLWIMGSFFILNLLFVITFYKELKITTFDPELAFLLGFSPTLINYLLMVLVSLTIVGSFQAIGVVLIVAFIIAPPSTSLLLTDNLRDMIIGSLVVATMGSIIGFYLGWNYDLSISGMVAVVMGTIFFIVAIFSPKKGIIKRFRALSEKKLKPPPHFIDAHGEDYFGGKL